MFFRIPDTNVLNVYIFLIYTSFSSKYWNLILFESVIVFKRPNCHLDIYTYFLFMYAFLVITLCNFHCKICNILFRGLYRIKRYEQQFLLVYVRPLYWHFKNLLYFISDNLFYLLLILELICPKFFWFRIVRNKAPVLPLHRFLYQLV